MVERDETRPVEIDVGEATLQGDLGVPEGARGLVVFAHGSGSSRLSPRNRFVASVMRDGGLATLLFDLLTEDEEQIDLRTRELRFDIGLLGRRLVGAIDWVGRESAIDQLAIGTFGSSTGAAAALIAAAERPASVRAVVSRGGRPDLAMEVLDRVRAPTLLIVGAHDQAVIPLNEKALAALRCEKKLELVPGATHLFEESGALEQVAALARDWFVEHLGSAR
jgi:pimeloyl-ACP methyl ester carboxylesterase